MRIRILKPGCRWGGKELKPGTIFENVNLRSMPPMWRGLAEEIKEDKKTAGGK